MDRNFYTLNVICYLLLCNKEKITIYDFNNLEKIKEFNINNLILDIKDNYLIYSDHNHVYSYLANSIINDFKSLISDINK